MSRTESKYWLSGLESTTKISALCVDARSELIGIKVKWETQWLECYRYRDHLRDRPCSTGEITGTDYITDYIVEIESNLRERVSCESLVSEWVGYDSVMDDPSKLKLVHPPSQGNTGKYRSDDRRF